MASTQLFILRSLTRVPRKREFPNRLTEIFRIFRNNSGVQGANEGLCNNARLTKVRNWRAFSTLGKKIL